MLWKAKQVAEWVYKLASTERVVVILSLFALYGKQILEAIQATPIAGISSILGPIFSGIDVFYWSGVAMMYFIHLFSIKEVYQRFDLELFDQYPSFYHAFAAVATVIAQYVLISSIPGQTAPKYLQSSLTTHNIAVVLPFFALIIFAKLRSNSPLSHPGSTYLNVLSKFGITEDERREVYNQSDFRRFGTYVMVIAVTAVYFSALLIMGSFTATLRIYPGVLEILAIVAVIGSKALRTSRMGKQRITLADRFEQAAAFDSPFYDVISDTPLGAGWGFMLALLLGTILVPLPILIQPGVGPFPIDTFLTGVSAFVIPNGIPTSQAIGMIVRSVFWVVFASTPYLVAIYGLWFWYQMARRTPSIIQQRALESEVFEYDEDVDTPPVARPRGWLLPAAGLLLVTFSHPLYQQLPGLPIAELNAPSIQIAAWITAFGLFGSSVLATATAEPELPRFPTVELLLPALLIGGSLVYASRQWGLLPSYAVLVGIIPFITYSEELFNWIVAPSRQSRILRSLPAGIFIGLGGWHVLGAISGVAYGFAMFATFFFTAEWKAREQVKESNDAESEKSSTE
ncbi:MULTISPECIES: hypothetical protein [Halolamina]|nr:MULTISPECIES: hypothetical protein [Halolamina]NHX37611.1 hypothetical protein [Halolamina sp. R1-12]